MTALLVLVALLTFLLLRMTFDPSCTNQGFLLKRRETGNWQRRWCVLTERDMEYYHSRQVIILFIYMYISQRIVHVGRWPARCIVASHVLVMFCVSFISNVHGCFVVLFHVVALSGQRCSMLRFCLEFLYMVSYMYRHNECTIIRFGAISLLAPFYIVVTLL